MLLKKKRDGRKRIIQLLSITLIWTIFASPAYSIDSRDYLAEFNNDGETCKILDGFYYINSDSLLTETVLYSCCKGTACTELPFDIKNLKENSYYDSAEIFEVNHIRILLKEGKISPTVYSFGDNFNFCDYYGFDVLKSEGLNLGAYEIERNPQYLPKNARILADASKAGKALGIIKEFNPGVFATSVVCHGLTDQETEAVQQIAMCNHFMTNIRGGNAYYGVSSDLKTCNSEASAKLKQVRDSELMRIKGLIDKLGNAASGLLTWSQDPINKNLEIKKSNYDILVEAYEKISKEDPQFGNSFSFEKASVAEKRFNEKNNETITKMNKLFIDRNNIISSKPFFIKIWLTNFFMDPNYNLTVYETSMEQAESELSKMNTYIHESRYNSAKSMENLIQKLLDSANENLKIEKETQRKYNYGAILIPFLIILLYLGTRIKRKKLN